MDFLVWFYMSNRIIRMILLNDISLLTFRHQMDETDKLIDCGNSEML